jgi:rifampicin phosphotransferase
MELSPPDRRFETYGMAYHRNQFRSQQSSASIETIDAELPLKGIGCCPGVVEGPVAIVTDPTAAGGLAGTILVAERTDPGWVPIFPGFSGILIERGSQLSHSAIVAREMGIPTIVGIRGLTTRLRSGQVVRMDGRAGTVKVVTE